MKHIDRRTNMGGGTVKFSDQLRAARTDAGLTQADCASRLGISKSAIEKWESGIKTPHTITQEGALLRIGKRGTQP